MVVVVSKLKTLQISVPEFVGLNPGNLVRYIDADLRQIKHVEDEEREGGNIRETLIVMATASDSDLQTLQEMESMVAAIDPC